MTVKNKTTLKSYFQTGDEPTQGQFADLIDSAVPFVDVKSFGAIGNGTHDDTAEITAAVAYAAANGTQLFWQDGTYLVSDSIPLLHTVKHIGYAVISRGGDHFHVNPKNGDANKLYCDPAGNNANDGLTPDHPILYIQTALDNMFNYPQPLIGTWTVQLAAGNYGGAYCIHLLSQNRIIIRGPDVGGHPNVPTAVIRSDVQPYRPIGLYFQNNVYASLIDVKCDYFPYDPGDAYGVVVEEFSDLLAQNVHCNNCHYAGFMASNSSVIRWIGGILSNSTFYGCRAYSQSSVSIGYSDFGGAGSSTEIYGVTNGAACQSTNSSRMHIDYCYIHNCNIGVLTQKEARSVTNYTAFNTIDYVFWNEGGNDEINPGNGDTYTACTSLGVAWHGVDRGNLRKVQYSKDVTYAAKGVTGGFRYGGASSITPKAPFEWLMDVGADAYGTGSGSDYNSGVGAIFDGTKATNYIAVSGPSTSDVGVLFCGPFRSAAGGITHNFDGDGAGNGRTYFYVDGVVLYAYDAAQFFPYADNAKTLGAAGNRWSVVYAGTGTINTSDANEKNSIEDVPEAVMKAWSKVKFKQFKFNGRNRKHIGVIAQDIAAAFTSEGLDAHDYGLFCEDIIDGKTYLGVRYDEALALECAYLRWKAGL